MKTIYKYPIKMTDEEQIIEMPKGSDVVNFVIKIDGTFLYAVVDTSVTETEKRKFFVCGTGWPIRCDAYKYIGAILLTEYEIYHLIEAVGELDEEQYRYGNG